MSTNSVRVLITGGRAPAALELARILHAHGHAVYAAESLAQHLCQYSNAVRESFLVPPPRQQPAAYLEQMEQLIRQLNIDVLIPTCEEIFYISHGLDRLQQSCRVWAPPLNLLHRLHHKGEFIELVRKAGLAVPDTCTITNSQQWQKIQHRFNQNEARDAVSAYASKLTPEQSHSAFTGNDQDTDTRENLLEQQLLPDWMNKQLFILKPAYSRFASKVILPASAPVQSDKVELAKSPSAKVSSKPISPALIPVPAALSAEQPWIAQTYLQGEQLCTYSIVYKGSIIAHTTYLSRYRSSKNGASVHFEMLQRTDTWEWVCTFIKGLYEQTGEHYSGQISFDLIEDAQSGKLYPLECNPRATSGIHLFQLEDGLEKALLNPEQAVSDNKLPLQPQAGSRVMLTLPMLVSGLGRGWRVQEWKQWLEAMKRAKDAVYRPEDKGPWFGQFGLITAAYRISRRKRITISEALTDDIEWNGELLPEAERWNQLNG